MAELNIAKNWMEKRFPSLPKLIKIDLELNVTESFVMDLKLLQIISIKVQFRGNLKYLNHT